AAACTTTRDRSTDAGVGRVQLADHQAQDGAHFVRIVGAFDEWGVSLADGIPIGAVVVRVGVIVALGGPGFLEDSHLFPLQVDGDFSFGGYGVGLAILDVDRRNFSGFEVVDFVGIGSELRMGAHSRGVGQLACRTVGATPSAATAASPSTAAGGFLFERVEVE